MTAKKSERAAGEEPRKEPGFEKALERLEKIVAEMEGGRLALEDMIARFEEGQSLIKVCTLKLNEVERRIETLVKKGDTVVAEPFEPEGDEDASRADATDGEEDSDPPARGGGVTKELPF